MAAQGLLRALGPRPPISSSVGDVIDISVSVHGAGDMMQGTHHYRGGVCLFLLVVHKKNEKEWKRSRPRGIADKQFEQMICHYLPGWMFSKVPSF